MITFYLIACLSTALITDVAGNMFNPFSPFSGFPSFPSFPNPFGSPFGSGFPFSQSFGSPFGSSDDSFASSSFPFQPPTPSFFPNTAVASSASQFPSPFNRGFSGGSFGFPSFPGFPSFTDFTNGLASGDLKGNGIKVTSTSNQGNSKSGSPGQVVQTIKVEKIGTENGPGEERRFVQTISASGPLIPTTGSNSSAKGNNQLNRPNQRPFAQRPVNNNQQQNENQQRKPQQLLRPTTTPVVTPTGLKINGTQSTSSQQLNVLNNSAGIGKPTSNQMVINPGNQGTGTTSSSKVSSSSASTSSQAIVGSQNPKVNGAGESVTSINSVNSDQSAAAKSSGGVTIRRVNSSGQIIDGF